MLVVQEGLSTQALVCMEKLKALNLSSIAAYLMNSLDGCGWNKQQVWWAIGQYKTFLFISYLYPKLLLVPTPEIDQVWHYHILHTKQYRQDCEILFGCYIDHEPNSLIWDEVNHQNLEAAFVQTQALLLQFQKYFETEALSEINQAKQVDCQLKFSIPEQQYFPFYRTACGRPKSYVNC